MVHGTKKTINNQLLTINSRQRRLGFTLLELLVVMAVIGILVTVVVFSVKNAQDKGADSRRKQDLRAIATALVSYYGDNEAYPPPCSPCPSSFEATSNAIDPWIPNLSSYIQRLPTDPKQTGISSGGCAGKKNVYCYIASLNRLSFVLWAQLENANDPERTPSGSSATCTETSPDPAYYNYCIKSPQ